MSEPDRPRVLVVDDETDIRQIVGMNLELAGMEPGEAADGEVALEMLASGEWEGCVLDISMPEMNGLEVLQHLRDRDLLDKIAVMVLSANGAPATALQAMTLGAHGHISKPFSPGSVAQGLRRLIDLGPAERAQRRAEIIERAANLERLGIVTI